MLNNIILLTDSYKVSHARQYPPKTQNIYSYFESRGGEFDNCVFFGLQYYLKRYLEGVVVTKENINEARDYYDKHLGIGMMNESGWNHIVNKCGGKLPVRIKAVPEGTIIPTSNVLMTVENTDPECYWLTNYIETLLVQIWYPITTATISKFQKNVLTAALEKSGDPSLVDFKLHDFGCRGVETMESAAIGGCAHLVNFMGSDTVPAIVLAREYYNEDMAAFSIPAAEHSTITSWGKDGEEDAFRNMLKIYPDGLVAVVSDSWDFRNAVKELWGKKLKLNVLHRNGTLIIRPDSGDPIDECVYALRSLYDSFGGKINDKGYRVLDDRVRIIQGDGITRNSLGIIINGIMDAGYSIDNIAFGSGGGLLQDCNRDTLKFAFKCSHATIDGKSVDVFKQPKTAAWKSSKKGRLKLVCDDTGYKTVSEYEYPGDDILEIVFENGEVVKEYTFKEVRENAK